MNYFAHAHPFLDEVADDPAFPYFLAGLAVPDWLTVVDRQCRVRLKPAEAHAADTDPVVAAVARGAAQHLRDDRQFHATPAFAESMIAVAGLSRRLLPGETGFRPAFLGHLLVELLLDAHLIAHNPRRLELYDWLLDGADPAVIEAAVNRIATQPTARLAPFVEHFRRARILWDYLEDGKLLYRVNQVMRRVGFEPLPETFLDLLPDARQIVDRRVADLLAGLPA